MPSVHFTLLLAVVVVASPLLILLLPLFLTFWSGKVIFNIACASCEKGQVLQSIASSFRLSFVVCEHIWYSLRHVPLMVNVLYHYTFLSSKRDGAKLNIPFEANILNGRRRLTPSSSGGENEGRNSSSSSNRESPIGALLRPPGHPLSCLDLYPCPVVCSKALAPVVVFVYGGAWGSGVKWWYSRLATMIQRECNVVCVIPSYPTFPAGNMLDMVETLHRSLVWVDENISLHGGDRRKIWLVGHSAGAHLCSLLALRRSLALASGGRCALPDSLLAQGDRRLPIQPLALWQSADRPRSRNPSTEASVDFSKTPALGGVILFSGVFDLLAHLQWEVARCVDRVSPMRAATDGYWAAHSPIHILHAIAATPPSDSASPTQTSKSPEDAAFSRDVFVSSMPLIFIFHDGKDIVVSHRQSEDLHKALAGAGVVQCEVTLVPGLGHGDVVMGPLKANKNLGLHPTLAVILSAMKIQKLKL